MRNDKDLTLEPKSWRRKDSAEKESKKHGSSVPNVTKDTCAHVQALSEPQTGYTSRYLDQFVSYLNFRKLKTKRL